MPRDPRPSNEIGSDDAECVRVEHIDCTPRLPDGWRELLARARMVGYPNSPTHQWAHRNYVRVCFPAHVDTTDPEVRDQLDAWWVLMTLPYDGMWQYWLTAPEGTEVANDD